jgi:uncharacterized Fe-S radical SAM superfamily protein PflX
LTIKPSFWAKAEKAVKSVGGNLIKIGRVTAERQIILDVEGERRFIEPRGWNISENTKTAFLAYPTVKESQFYEKLRNGKVKCGLCERRCEIATGKVGFCRTRMNFGGKLYTLVYGDISAIESRPIEIKPFFHYWPGSTALTFSTWSCNFDCVWCQNFHLSKVAPEPVKAVYHSPEKIVELALAYGTPVYVQVFKNPHF